MTRCKTMATSIAASMAFAASALTLGTSAFAQGTGTGTGTGTNTGTGTSGAAAGTGMTTQAAAMNGSDRQFVLDAAKGGMAEVAMGQLAQQKGSSDVVKQFGARMVEDHTKTNDELKQLASAKGLTLPATPPKNAKMQKMEAMSGAAFDHAYMAEMLTDHKKDVALFEKQSRANGGDPELKAFATKTLPTLQAHLQMVQSQQHTGGGAMKH